MTGVVGSSSRMSGSGRETPPDDWEWSGGLPGCPRVVKSLSRKFGRPSGCTGAVGTPSRMSLRGGVLPDVREWSGGPPGCARVVRRTSRMSRSGREVLPVVRKWSEDPSKGAGCPLGYLGVVGGPP